MNTLFISMMDAWPLLLHSLVPLLLAIVCLVASIYLIAAPGARRTPRRRFGGYLIAAGNLLATASWCLIYADTVLPLRRPLWDYGAPISALACLALLPVAALWLISHRKELHLTGNEMTAFGLSLVFQLVSIFPGLYLLGFYLVIFSGSA